MKKTFTYKTFSIFITKDGIYRKEKKNFSGPDLSSQVDKLYVVTCNNEFIYVGQTKQKMGDKFRQSFRSYLQAKNDKKDKSGYSGYKWIEEFMNKKDKLNLHIIRFDLGTLKIEKQTNFVKAVEAELVFEIRQMKGKWPLNQNEIHFYNDFDNANKIAKEIYNSLV